MIDFRQDPKGNLKIWQFPDRKSRYIIPADISEGLEGGNYSAAHVIDLESFEQVACWHGLEEPYQFGKILFNLGEYYNGALLAPERNNNGISTIDYLRANSYPNIYRMLTPDREELEETDRLGWITNMHTRPLIIDALKESVRSNALILNDSDTLSELRTFVRNPKTGKVEASEGSMDDLVISLAIGCYIRSTMNLNFNHDEAGLSHFDMLRERWGVFTSSGVGRGGY